MQVNLTLVTTCCSHKLYKINKLIKQNWCGHFLKPSLSLMSCTFRIYSATSLLLKMSFPSLNKLQEGQIITWDQLSIALWQESHCHQSCLNLGSFMLLVLQCPTLILIIVFMCIFNPNGDGLPLIKSSNYMKTGLFFIKMFKSY